MFRNRLKRYTAMVAVAMAVLVLSGCKESAPPSIQSKSADVSSQSVVEQESSSESAATSTDATTDLGVDADGLPVMTEENQKYYDKYIAPFYAGPPFIYSFSKDNFYYFYASSVYSCLNQIEEPTEVPNEVVEEFCKKYFPVSTEEMQELDSWFSRYQCYDIINYNPRGQFRAVVTASEKNGNELILTCDWYEADHVISESPRYTIYFARSNTTIDITSADQPFYISNESSRDYGSSGADSVMGAKKNMDQVAQEAFEIWKCMGYKPLSFFLEKDSSIENLTELYTEFCLNNKSDDQFLTYTQEKHLNTAYEKYINRNFFKMPGFVEFAEKYFAVSVDKAALKKYEAPIDAYPVSPSYLHFDENAVNQISLESYEASGNGISIIINYANQGSYALKVAVDEEGNFTFTSLQGTAP